MENKQSNSVYVVYGETYYESYGSRPAIFGVFDTLDEAMEFKEEKNRIFVRKRARKLL